MCRCLGGPGPQISVSSPNSPSRFQTPLTSFGRIPIPEELPVTRPKLSGQLGENGRPKDPMLRKPHMAQEAQQQLPIL